MKQFLSSTWTNTLVFTWEIEPELLMEHIPHKIGLYTENGKAFISFIAYNFENTKVKGVKMPFHVSFPEMDLRYYVKHNHQIGVGFIQHIVPRYCISLWAKRIFNENYITLPMELAYQETETSKVIHYKVWKNKSLFSIEFFVNKEVDTPSFPLYNKVEFGSGVDKHGNSISFKFDKLKDFASFTSVDFAMNIDFAFLFGRKWGFLNHLEPLDISAFHDNKIRIFQPTYIFDNPSGVDKYLQAPSFDTIIVKENPYNRD